MTSPIKCAPCMPLAWGNEPSAGSSRSGTTAWRTSSACQSGGCSQRVKSAASMLPTAAVTTTTNQHPPHARAVCSVNGRGDDVTGISRNTQREQLARRIECMRPTDDAVHEAMLEATQYGVTYAAIAGATGSTELRAQRWSAGADIPGTVAERRAILSTLQRLLSEMPSAPDRRRKTIDGRHESRTERNDRLATVLCMHCQRVAGTGDTCGRRACRRVA